MMQWNSVGDFLAMGGYGFYVWGSFGACALAMAVESFLIRQQRVELLRSLKDQHEA